MPGTHQHRCDGCGNIWEHSDDMFGDVAAHTCRNCGRMQWWKYLGDCFQRQCQALKALARELFLIP